MVRAQFFTLIFVFCCLSTWAQKDLSKPARSVTPITSEAAKAAKPEKSKQQKKIKEKGKFKERWAQPYPNPYRAAIYTLVLPGAGQIYNKRYWKVPFVWGGFAGLVYAVNYNKRQYQCFDEAFGLESAGLPHKYSEFRVTASSLQSQRDAANKNLQLSYIGFVAMYAISALDAYVDAHLKNFDISDDLSLAVKPIVAGGLLNGVNPGLGIVWQFD